MLKLLEDGRTLLDHGPIQMVLDISTNGKQDQSIIKEVVRHVLNQLDLAVKYIDIIKEKKHKFQDVEEFPPVVAKMIKAVKLIPNSHLTPLAAVAGSFSEIAMEKAIELGARRIIINNGGDIALNDLDKNPITVALPLDKKTGSNILIPIFHESGIRGICTSGLGGRSFTKGIATAAVALANTPSNADACATYLGNATNVEDQNIIRCYAEEIDSHTDIPGHLVTLKVGNLPKKKIYTALVNGLKKAEELYSRNIIKGAVLCIDNEIVMIPDNLGKLG